MFLFRVFFFSSSFFFLLPFDWPETAQREADPASQQGNVELRADRNHGSAQAFGGGGENSWKKQDQAMKGLDALDSMFDEVLK